MVTLSEKRQSYATALHGGLNFLMVGAWKNSTVEARSTEASGLANRATFAYTPLNTFREACCETILYTHTYLRPQNANHCS